MNPLQRAQAIVGEVLREFPDIATRDLYLEYERRVNDPNYMPKEEG